MKESTDLLNKDDMIEPKDLIITTDDENGVIVSERDGCTVVEFYWQAGLDMKARFNARELAEKFIETVTLAAEETVTLAAKENDLPSKYVSELQGKVKSLEDRINEWQEKVDKKINEWKEELGEK